jgi:uncharacterized protein YkwD
LTAAEPRRYVERVKVLLVAGVCLVGGCADLFAIDDDPGGHPDFDLSDCEAVADWDPAWAAFEDDVLELTNDARARGHDCDSAGRFGPAAPLAMSAALRCAARQHSGYMAETGEFSHDESQNGSDPFERISATGYQFSAAGENIALGQRSPDEVVAGWLESDGHCANIMNPDFTELGVGYAEGSAASLGFSNNDAPYWTQVFARPR